jgi:hypothetical protein
MEKHHPSGRARDPDTTVLICSNCHCVLSDDQKDHPPFNSDTDKLLDMIGHFLLGLADMLRIVIEKLYLFGRTLIERAATEGTAA